MSCVGRSQEWRVSETDDINENSGSDETRVILGLLDNRDLSAVIGCSI